MGTLELKNLLIHRIAEINDVAFLKAIKTMLDAGTSMCIFIILNVCWSNQDLLNQLLGLKLVWKTANTLIVSLSII